MNKTFRMRAVAGLVSSALLAGCTVDPQKETAPYVAVLNGGIPAPMMRVAPGQPITLTDALRLSNQNDPGLQIQGETYVQSLIQKDARFAAFLPTINFSPSYSRQGGSQMSTSHNFTTPFVGTVNVFNGFQDVNGLKQQDATIEQQKQLLLDLQQSVLLEVAQTYYQVLTSEQSVEVLANSLSVQQERVRQTVDMSRVGKARPLDVAQAQAQASQTRVTLLQAQTSVRDSRSLLAYLLDAPVQNSALSDDYQPPADMPVEAAFQWQAETARQDLRAAQNQTLAARKGVDIAIGQYYPTVNVNLSGVVYQDPPPIGPSWSGLLSLDLPIFTGGLIEANVRTAWSQYRQAFISEMRLRRNIDDAVYEAYENLQLVRRELNELQVEVNAAKDALSLADEMYLTQRATLLDRLVAQDTLLTAQLQLTEAQFQQKTAYLNLLRTAGQLTVATALIPVAQPAPRVPKSLATQPALQPGESLPTSRP